VKIVGERRIWDEPEGDEQRSCLAAEQGRRVVVVIRPSGPAQRA
jgi:hypothetical protein